MDVLVQGISKKYNGRTVLDVDKLCFEQGKVYAILGLNGSGKSTLLECIAGLQKPDSGKILYNGNLTIDSVRNNISMMTQKPYLFNETVLENIESGLEFKKTSKSEITRLIEKYLQYFDINELLHQNAKKLSGGEAAKTALLRTAVLETDLTLLDEPTASMDIESTLNAEKIIREMVQNHRTVIIVTHDLYQAQRCADEVIFMDKGRVMEADSPLLKMILNQRQVSRYD